MTKMQVTLSRKMISVMAPKTRSQGQRGDERDERDERKVFRNRRK